MISNRRQSWWRRLHMSSPTETRCFRASEEDESSCNSPNLASACSHCISATRVSVGATCRSRKDHTTTRVAQRSRSHRCGESRGSACNGRDKCSQRLLYANSGIRRVGAHVRAHVLPCKRRVPGERHVSRSRFTTRRGIQRDNSGRNGELLSHRARRLGARCDPVAYTSAQGATLSGE